MKVAMMAPDVHHHWFRTECDIISNPKLRLLTDTMQLRFFWCLALHAQGKLVGVPVERLAFALRLTSEDVTETLEALMAAELLLPDRTPKGWAKYQKLSDHSTGRVRKHRAKKRAEQAKRDETVSPCSGNEHRTGQNRTEQNRTGGSSPPSPVATEPQRVMLESMASERGTSLPEVLSALGLQGPILAEHVTRVRAHLEASPRATPEDAQRAARRAHIDAAWSQALPLLRDAQGLAKHLAGLEDDGARHALVLRSSDWLSKQLGGERQAHEAMRLATGAPADEIPTLTVETIPAVWRAANIDHRRPSPIRASEAPVGDTSRAPAGATSWRPRGNGNPN
ncbi:MAG TPA: hypothetical protein P5571_07225 [Candidatus Krumholzibacteria bacterium]|nr:hypothetical protein [Candidatus Krumholzibacteria bacterium]HRX51137.1 hypothetical protein [Candidatus Krumholzibacteria bacterium]